MAPEQSGWLELCRRAVEAQRRIFAEHAGIESRTAYEGVGGGGDRTLVIDRLCEDAVVAELEALHAAGAPAMLLIAEERGEVAIGEGEPAVRVVLDPIDGSLNARRTIPAHCLSLAVASGPMMSDVEFGYVYDFGAGEEFEATRAGGARIDGRELSVPPGRGLELVAIEAASPEVVAPVADRLRDRAYRVRTPGSIAISLAYVAAGRFDGMLSGRPCRSVDAAAAQLIAREAGATVEFGGPPDGASLALEARYPVAACRDEGDLATLIEARGAVL